MNVRELITILQRIQNQEIPVVVDIYSEASGSIVAVALDETQVTVEDHDGKPALTFSPDII